MSSSQMVDLVFSLFYFSFLFYFQFVFLFSIFRATRVRVDQLRYHHQSQSDGIITRQIMKLGRIQQKIQEQMTLYNMDITCWPHKLHMVVQGRVHNSQHRPSVRLYNVDQFVEEFSIEFSYVSLIQEQFLFLTLRNKFITSNLMLWDILDTNKFPFFYFIFLILFFFFLLFFFSLIDKETHDTIVT